MILRFSEDLSNTNWKTRLEAKDEKGNSAWIRLVYGDDEVMEKKQDPNAKLREFKTGACNINVDGILYYQTEITEQSIINFHKKSPYWNKGVWEYDPLADNKKKAELLVRDTNILGKVAAISDNTDLVKYGYFLFGKHPQKSRNDGGRTIEAAPDRPFAGTRSF